MRSVVAIVAAVFLTLASCVEAAPRAALAPVRIEVPGAHNLQFLSLWVALGAGYFQEEGLDPKIAVARGPRLTGQAMLRGDADVALLPPPMFLGMMAEEKPILLFANLLSNEPINLVVRKEIADARRIAARITLSERLHAIEGLKIGLAGEVAPRLREIAAAAGMDADKDFQLVTVAGPDQVDAFASGAVDVLFSHTPYLETALVRHGGVLLVHASSGEVPGLAGGQIHALVTTRVTAREKPELIESVTRAILRAQRLIQSDLKAATDAIIASGAANDRALVEAIVAVYAPAIPMTPRISLEGIMRDTALYPAHPRAPDFTRVKAEDFVASEFAERAAR